MAERYNPKNLTLVEILVIVFLCLFFLAVAVPAANKSRSDAFRAACADNLSHISRAMLIYSNDYDDKLPRAGGRNSEWSSSGGPGNHSASKWRPCPQWGKGRKARSDHS